MVIHHLQSWQVFPSPLKVNVFSSCFVSQPIKTLKSCWITPQKLSNWATAQVKFKIHFIIHTAFSGLSHCQLHYGKWLTDGLTLPAMWPFTAIIHSKLKILSHPYVVPNLSDFLSSVEHTWCFEECSCCSFPIKSEWGRMLWSTTNDKKSFDSFGDILLNIFYVLQNEKVIQVWNYIKVYDEFFAIFGWIVRKCCCLFTNWNPM